MKDHSEKEGMMCKEMKQDGFLLHMDFLHSTKCFSNIKITLSLVHNAFTKV